MGKVIEWITRFFDSVVLKYHSTQNDRTQCYVILSEVMQSITKSKDLLHYARTLCREGLYVPPRFEDNKIHNDKLINVN